MSAHRSSARRSPKGNRDIQILWTNVGRSSPCHITALQIAYDQDADIVCIQEPFVCSDTRTSTHPGYTHYPPVDAWDSPDPTQFETQRPRVMTYIRRGAGLRVTPRASLNDRDLQWLEVNGISVLNVYRQPQTTRALHYVINLTPPSKTIIGGDFNAKHDMFEPGIETSQGGSELAKWSTDSGMDYIGQPGKPTHRAGHVIDLTFSNIPFARTEVQDDLHSGSDHNVLITTVPGRGVTPLEQVHNRIPEDRLPMLAGLIQLGMEGIPRVINTAEQIEQSIQRLTTIFAEAIATAGKPDRGAGRSAPWWTPECKQKYKLHINSLPGEGRGPTPETREFLAEVRRAKRDYWRHTIDNVESDKDLFRIIGWHQLEPTRQEKPLIVDDQTFTTPEDKAEALHKAILCRFNANDDLPNPPQDPEHPTLPWDTTLTMEEVERSTIAVSSTSPGPDKITVRLLKAAWDHIKDTILAIYRRCLALNYFPHAWKLAEVAMITKVGKRDKTSPRSWRPIALLSCLGKGLERVLARRIAWTAMKHGILSPQHGGALPKRSAMDLAAAFTHDVEKAFSMGKHVTMVTMDVQGAFDALLKNRLLHRMASQGWTANALHMINSFLSNRRVRVRLGKATTPEHRVQCGTPQGSPLSPVLYTLYLAELMTQDTQHRFGYADDICLHRATHSLDSNVSLLAADIRAIQEWGRQNHIAFAPEKLEMIHLTRQKGNYAPVCRVDDDLTIQPIQPATGETPALRWLGVFFDRKLTFKKHVTVRAAKARKVALHIRSLARTTCGPPASSLRKAVITCVLPRLLYGTEAWYGGRTKPPMIMRQDRKTEVSTRLGWHVDIIDKTIALAARGVLPVYRTTPTPTLFRDAGLPAGPVALEQAKVRFAIRLHTVDSKHPLVKRMQTPVIARGRGAGHPERPKTLVQRVGQELQPAPRPELAEPHYTPGSRVDPTEGVKKKEAAKAFNKWWAQLPHTDITVFSDGSEQKIEGTRHVTYGYTIYEGNRSIADGRGSLNTRSHVFDAEAIGAWRGLAHALRTPAHRTRRIWQCIDSTSVIWCIRGNAALSSQWAFLKCQEAAEVLDIRTKWAPGHTRIQGNEEADHLANLEAKDPHQPYGPAADPTVSGLRTDAKALQRHAERSWWRRRSNKLSGWYKQWELQYKTTPPAELSLHRPILAKLLATRTKHGDYAWYHKKFKHEDASLTCACGRDKSPEHIVHCRRSRRLFLQWPLRPLCPPDNSRDGLKYLRELLDSPEDFADFVRLTSLRQ